MKKDLRDLVVGDNVEYYLSQRQNKPISKESKVVKITKTQIHIEFKNGDAPANGEIRKYNRNTGCEIGRGVWGSCISAIDESEEAIPLTKYEQAMEELELSGSCRVNETELMASIVEYIINHDQIAKVEPGRNGAYIIVCECK